MLAKLSMFVSLPFLFFMALLCAVPDPRKASSEMEQPELTPTQTVISATPTDSSIFSEKVRFVAKIVPTYVPKSLPSGTVQFFVDKELVSTQPILNNIASLTISSLSTAANAHRISAVYSGDTIYAGSSDLINFTVLPAPTSVLVVSKTNPSTWGEAALFTIEVRVQPPGQAIPRGAVQIQIDGNAPQKIPLDERGQASFSSNAMEVGERQVTATFLGNNDFRTSSNRILQQVDKAATEVVLKPVENPALFGKAIEVVATVSSAVKDKIPLGEVQFRIDGKEIGTPIHLNEKGEAQTNLPVLNVGAHEIGALYFGNDHFYDSSHAVIQKIDQAPTNSSLISSKNPSIYGSNVVLTSSVSAENATPTGYMAFSIDKTTVAKQPLDSAGNATYSLSNRAAGKYAVTATYQATPNFKSSSAQLTQEISKADTAVTITPSQNPSVYSYPLAFTAHVTSEFSNPKGSVQFAVDGIPFETKRLDSSGRSSIEISVLDAGERTITANYLGNENFQTSSVNFVQHIQKAGSSITLHSSENPSSYGTRVILKAAVSSEAATPVGSVQFLVDGILAETKTLNSNAEASLSIPHFEAGSHTITVNFLENVNFQSASESFVQQVDKANSEISLISRMNPAPFGSEVEFFSAVVSRNGKPEGSVEFKIDGSVVATTTLDINNQSVFKVSNLDVGKHDIVATYVGNSNFNSSTASLQQIMEPKKEEDVPKEESASTEEKVPKEEPSAIEDTTKKEAPGKEKAIPFQNNFKE